MRNPNLYEQIWFILKLWLKSFHTFWKSTSKMKNSTAFHSGKRGCKFWKYPSHSRLASSSLLVFVNPINILSYSHTLIPPTIFSVINNTFRYITEIVIQQDQIPQVKRRLCFWSYLECMYTFFQEINKIRGTCRTSYLPKH
jgi:hypothetical protein